MPRQLGRAQKTLLLIALPMLGIQAAFAAAPQRKSSAPAYYSSMLGDIELTALSDGSGDWLDVDIASNLTTKDRDAILARNHYRLPFHGSTNAFLINTGTKLVLVDAGLGLAKQANWTMGRLLPHLRAAGYEPEQVDEVLLTHLHFDHVGGLTHEGKPVFVNAVVRADAAELPAWQKQAASAEPQAAAQAKMVLAKLQPYLDAGRFKPFDANAELAARRQSNGCPLTTTANLKRASA